MKLEHLRKAITEFKGTMDYELKSSSPDNFKIVAGLLNVFIKANELLKKGKDLSAQAPVFDLMKTLSPYLTSKKKVLDALKEEYSKDKKYALALALLEEEKKVYGWYLDKANRAVGGSKKRKFMG